MDLFEMLDRRANRLAPRWGDWGRGSFDRGRKAGIDATIEALEEMMVDKPITGVLKHDKSMLFEDQDITCVEDKDLGRDEFRILLWEGHRGTDGEEVYVVVVRRGKAK